MIPKRRILPIFVPHAGCPHQCVFCNQKRISGSLLPAGAQDVGKAVSWAEAMGFREMELAFYGGSFTAIPAPEQISLLESAAPYLKSGVLSSIRISTRPDAIDGEILKRLAHFGVRTIELGAQSMDAAVLQCSGRGHTPEDTRRSAEQIRNAGFQLVLQMMTGLPGADAASDIATAEEIIALKPDGVRIYPTVVIENTELYDRWKSGNYLPHTVEAATEVCAEIVPLFERAEIPVIRLGLNPTEELSRGVAAAGAYHPALGELVYSRIYLNKAIRLLEELVPESREITLEVAERDVSKMVGQHRRNLLILKEKFGFSHIRVAGAPVKPGDIRIVFVAKG